MSLNKEAYIRYKIIDDCLRDKQKSYPSMDNLIDCCQTKLGKTFVISTIQKDIKAMKEDDALGFNAPIKFSKSNNGYYYSDKDYSINKLPLQKDEIALIVETQELLQAIGDKHLSEEYKGAFIKLMNALQVKSPLKKDENLFVYSQKTKQNFGFDNYQPLLDSIKKKEVITFLYYSLEVMDLIFETIHPFQLIEFNGKWYLLAYSERIKKIRVYGLDRIMPDFIYEANKKFIDSKRSQVNKYNFDMYGIYPLEGEKKQEITFWTSKPFKYFLETHALHSTQKMVDDTHEHLTLWSIKVIPTHELLKWFLANCEETRLVTPALRKRVVEIGKKAFASKK